MTRILIPCGFTARNKGDQLLMRALMSDIEEVVAQGVTFGVITDDPDRDSLEYKAPAWRIPLSVFGRCEGALSKVIGSYSRIVIAGIVIVLCLLSELLPDRTFLFIMKYLFRQTRREGQLEISEYDLALAAPGGYLMAHRSRDWDWLRHFILLRSIQRSGLRLTFAPASFGPFAPGHRFFARRVLGPAKVIVARDDASVGFLADIGVAEHVSRQPDLALTTTLLPPPGNTTAKSAPVLGVSVRDHHFNIGGTHTASQIDIAMDVYLETIASVGSEFSRRGYRVVVVPQCVGQGCDDLATGRRLLDHSSVNFEILDNDASLRDLITLYSSLTLLIGTRMHANLIALRCGVPVIALAYEEKTTEIMAQLGLSHWTLEIDKIDNGRLMDRAFESINRSEKARTDEVSRACSLAYRRRPEWLETLSELIGQPG